MINRLRFDNKFFNNTKGTNMIMKITQSILIALVAVPWLVADITDARITEVWVGRSGADGTQDWIEVTNTGNTLIDTGELLYDDSMPMTMSGGLLQSIILQPGESAVFLLSAVADNQTNFPNAGVEFLAVWVPFDINFLGVTAGGGALSQSGDEANLLDPNTGAIIDTLTYTGAIAGSPMTIERIGDGSTDIRRSVLGQNGAFEAQPFIDEATGMIAVDDNGDPVILIGSPGIFMNSGILLGDVNCDGVIDLLDVSPFVAVLTSGGFDPKADINQDGQVTLTDVAPFVALLTGG
jgi:hypothetical protein